MLSLISPEKTFLHGLKAETKLGFLSVATVFLYFLKNPIYLGFSLAFILALYLLAGGLNFLQHGFKMLRPIWFFVFVLWLWHIYDGRIHDGLIITMRLIAAVSIANLVTMTTKLSEMTYVLEKLLSPLSWLIPPQRIALAFTLAIRFLPVLLERAERVRDALRSRCVSPSGWRVFAPLTLAMLDDAEYASEALRARGGVIEKRN